MPGAHLALEGVASRPLGVTHWREWPGAYSGPVIHRHTAVAPTQAGPVIVHTVRSQTGPVARVEPPSPAWSSSHQALPAWSSSHTLNPKP